MKEQLQNSEQYPYFSAWEEALEFEVEGVAVMAIAKHSSREETVRIDSPFVVDGDKYLIGFRPPLVVLAAAMIARRKSLELCGITVRDDCIRMARNLYLHHSTKLMIQPEVDRTQMEFITVFNSELTELSRQSTDAQEKLRFETHLLRQEFKSNRLTSVEYNSMLLSLRAVAKPLKDRFETLQRDVSYELECIERNLIHAAIQHESYEIVEITR
jgi:hypothetical protein